MMGVFPKLAALGLVALTACASPRGENNAALATPQDCGADDSAFLHRAEAERADLLERELARLGADLDEAEQALVAVESGLRGSKSRADAVSALAEGRIAVQRAGRQVRWRPDSLKNAKAKLDEAERQLDADHFSASIFFSSRAARIGENLIEEASWASSQPAARYVKANRVNLREGPSLEERVKRVLLAGTPVFPERDDGDWLLVRTAGGRVGWIHESLIR